MCSLIEYVVVYHNNRYFPKCAVLRSFTLAALIRTPSHRSLGQGHPIGYHMNNYAEQTKSQSFCFGWHYVLTAFVEWHCNIYNIHHTLYGAPKNTAGAVYDTWGLETIKPSETVARNLSVT